MKCKACNKMLTKKELQAKNPINGQPEDLCGICLEGIQKDYVEIIKALKRRKDSKNNEQG